MYRAQSNTLLQRHREAAGLTQEQLAERAGISRPTVCSLERAGAPARTPALEAVAEALGLEAEALIPDVIDNIERGFGLEPNELRNQTTERGRKLAATLQEAKQALAEFEAAKS